MIFTKDKAKQEAAWKFIKFACGPEGGTMMVRATGYMPASTIPAQRRTCWRSSMPKIRTT